MYDKSRYSYLIGFIRQLGRALRDADDEPELADELGTLALHLDALLGASGEGLGDDDDGDDAPVVDDDGDGDDPPLGSPAVRTDRRPAAMDVTRKRISASGKAVAGQRLDPVGKRRRAAVLNRGRRGKK